MEIQSNTAASSLFDGLAQSTTQGTGAKDDMFSKMMETMLTDAVTRKREQADAAAKDSAKDAARDARDAKADALRKAPIRAERPRFDSASPLREAVREPVRAEAPPPAPRAAEAKTADRADSKPTAADTAKDAPRATAEELARKTERTDKPTAKDVTKDTKQSADASAQTAEAGDPTVETDVAADATDEDAAGGTDAQASAEQQAADAATTILDVTLTITETTVEIVTPTSDTLPASLQLTGMAALPNTAAIDTATETASDAAPAEGDAVTAPVAPAPADPAAQLAAQLAQVQQSATKTAGQTEVAGQAKAAAPVADAALTNTVPAEIVDPTIDGKAAETAEALPTDDDTALPTGFADLIAAAKAKAGEKSGTKQTGTDSGGRNDSQPQPQTTPFQAAPAAPGPVAASLKSAAEGQAVGALTGTEATAPTAAAAPHTPGSHTHAALAGMEAPHAAAPIDSPQATAVLRPSRGSVGMPLGVPDQLSVHIKKNVADDIDQFTINLHPAELGRIDIKLDIGADGRVNAMVAVEKAQTLELLQRDSRNLEKALQDAGLRADSDSLNFSLRGEGNPFQGEGNGSGKRGRGGRGNGEPDPAEAVAYTVTLGEGRVDIRA